MHSFTLYYQHHASASVQLLVGQAFLHPAHWKGEGRGNACLGAGHLCVQATCQLINSMLQSWTKLGRICVTVDKCLDNLTNHELAFRFAVGFTVADEHNKFTNNHLTPILGLMLEFK